ncbi:oxidoreductase, NAD-binding Rossmann fold family protein [Clostridium sporogenes]|uniref:Oxidoreductase, NAD-binding Rossmann fold family protein n=1 Tax=Clostridium sporogenes TaxID=1509 RepID=A0A1L3NH55_CLOSG|nr:Gfo/Idh/MocA family oxidoreductase [Clostridium sporogenes]APH15470.1 oxidoreductase, NAD-binding Rossmann fold family protein [Clostridium sporogenes]
MSNVKIGIVGLGNISQKVYLPFLCKEENWSLIGAYSPTKSKRRKICNQYRINEFSNLTDLLENCDAVFVNSSTDSHFEVVSEAIKKHKDVYVDKPLASSLDETEQLVELSIKNNRKLMVGFNRRFAPMYVEAKNNINSTTSLIRLEKHRIDSIRSENFKTTLLDDYIHLVDTARWLDEPNDCVDGFININDKKELIFAEHSYKSKEDIKIFFDMHRKCGTNLERLEIITKDSIIRVKDMNTMEIEKEGKIEINKPSPWETAIKIKGFENAILHFINSIIGNTKPIVDGVEGLKSQKLLNDIINARNN